MEQLILPDYTIYIGDIWAQVDEDIQSMNPSQLFVLCDTETEKYCLPRWNHHMRHLNYHLHVMPNGEANKTLDTCTEVWNAMMEKGLDRHALVVNLGGGVVGDLGGFCASTYMRGIRFIHLPTTLLSQVDSSIGGKLGVDLDGVKNMVGVFAQPQGVYILPMFLETLPLEEIHSGFAEMVKHALIDDRSFWELLSTFDQLQHVNWDTLLVPAISIKQMIVEIDPFENLERKQLNFGHTVGHALESLFLEKGTPITHGHAIALGMMVETVISREHFDLAKATKDKILSFFSHLYEMPPLEAIDIPTCIAYMRKDKKNRNQDIRMALLKDIGLCEVDISVKPPLIEAALRQIFGL